MRNLGFGGRQPFPTPQIGLAQPRGLIGEMVGLDKKVKNKTGVRDFRVPNWDLVRAGMGLLGGSNPLHTQVLNMPMGWKQPSNFGQMLRSPEFLRGLMSLWR